MDRFRKVVLAIAFAGVVAPSLSAMHRAGAGFKRAFRQASVFPAIKADQVAGGVVALALYEVMKNTAEKTKEHRKAVTAIVHDTVVARAGVRIDAASLLAFIERAGTQSVAIAITDEWRNRVVVVVNPRKELQSVELLRRVVPLKGIVDLERSFKVGMPELPADAELISMVDRLTYTSESAFGASVFGTVEAILGCDRQLCSDLDVLDELISSGKVAVIIVERGRPDYTIA